MTLSKEAVAYLERHHVGHLATVDAAGRPHVVPVCFAVHAGRVYLALDEKPKRTPPDRLQRLRNIAAQPAVCLTVDDYDEDWTRLSWLQVRGQAALVSEASERTAALAALRARYPQYRTMALEERPLLAITPERLVRWQATEETMAQDIIGEIEQGRAALAGLVESQPAAVLTRPNTVGAWSITDVLAHLAGWQDWMGRAYPLRFASGVLPEELRSAVRETDATNHGFVLARRDHSTADLLAELAAGLEPLRRWLAEIGERAEQPPAWQGTELSVVAYLREFLVNHERDHREQIAAALANG